jgi:hypothetical protein
MASSRRLAKLAAALAHPNCKGVTQGQLRAVVRFWIDAGAVKTSVEPASLAKQLVEHVAEMEAS